MSNPLSQRKSNGLGAMSFQPGSPWGTSSSQSTYGSLLPQMQAQQNIFGMYPGRILGVDDVIEKPPAVDAKKLAVLKKVEPRMVTKRMPDGIVPAVAWRAWGLKTVNGEWRLSGLGVDAIWEPKKPMAADCKTSLGGNHPAPNKNCSCGVWSFTTLDKLVSLLSGYQTVVLGEVSIWGRIIECENGYRSQFAYPKELWILDNSVEELGYIYGVPVRTMP